MKTRLFTVIILGLALSFQSCKKDEGTPDPNSDETLTGAAKIKLDHRFGAAGFETGTEYTTGQGEKITFATARYRISNIRFKKADGSWWSQPESYYLVNTAGTNPAVLDITGIPAGEYTAMSYTIGVDSTRNVSGAQTGSLDPALGMFWSWNSGYIFIALEGTSPASDDGSFAYHIGGFSGASNAIRTNTREFGAHTLKIKPDAVPQIHYMIDFAKAFEQVKLETVSKIHMPGPDAAAFADHFAASFTLDHIHD